MTDATRPVVRSPEERRLAEAMCEARDKVLAIVMRFDATDPLVILEHAMARVIRERCRGNMHKAAELVGQQVIQQIRKQSR